jgi:predicted regulator of Ras-like GTPase activity (Roadblock/LC7/MglB family)
MIIATVEPWVEPPLKRYVDDARARLALVLHPSGQVIAQAGFTRAVDVMTACALASAVHATAGELGRRLDGRPFTGLHHAGAEKQLYLAPVETARGAFICMTVFDRESSLGLVRMFFAELSRELAAAAPPVAPVREAALGVNFERELHANLTALFAGGPRDAASGPLLL